MPRCCRGPWPQKKPSRSRCPAAVTTSRRPPRVSPEEPSVMEDVRRVALYARVSSQRQADEATIESQVAALESRLRADGCRIDPELRFLDDGHSGSTLRRPALERLRDLIHAGGVERLYVHAPDRLARKFAHQAVLLEEFHRRHVEVVFLNAPRSEASPEADLFLQMQGMIAEYERAKILERTRRGRRFGARQGRVSVLGQAPYGYRYVRKHEGGGEARYEVVPDEARVVRDLFRWVGLEGLSLAAVARRLAEQGVPTRTGQRPSPTARAAAAPPAVSRAATPAHQQPAQQVTGTDPTRSVPLSIRRQSLGRRVKQVLANQCRHRDPLVFRHRRWPRDGLASGPIRLPPAGSPFAAAWLESGLAPVRFAVIGGVAQDPPQRRPPPPPLAGPRRHALLGQAPGHRRQRQALQADPAKQVTHHPRFVRHDLVTGFAAAFVLADIAVAVRRLAQHADPPLAGAEATPAARALENLRPLVFGDHPLHLQEQVGLRRRLRPRRVEEHDLDVTPVELFQQDRLMRELARQAVGRVHVKPLDAAGVDEVAQPLQGRAPQRAAAVAVVQEAQLRVDATAVGAETAFQGRHLALDGRLVGLALRADAGVQGHAADVLHDARLLGRNPRRPSRRGHGGGAATSTWLFLGPRTTATPGHRPTSRVRLPVAILRARGPMPATAAGVSPPWHPREKQAAPKRHLPLPSAPPQRRTRDDSMKNHRLTYNIVCGVNPARRCIRRKLWDAPRAKCRISL